MAAARAAHNGLIFRASGHEELLHHGRRIDIWGIEVMAQRLVAHPDRELARSALKRLGVSGRLDRVASGLDTHLLVAPGQRGGLRPPGWRGPAIRRPAAIVAEAGWLQSLGGRTHFVVPR